MKQGYGQRKAIIKLYLYNIVFIHLVIQNIKEFYLGYYTLKEVILTSFFWNSSERKFVHIKAGYTYFFLSISMESYHSVSLIFLLLILHCRGRRNKKMKECRSMFLHFLHYILFKIIKLYSKFITCRFVIKFDQNFLSIP